MLKRHDILQYCILRMHVIVIFLYSYGPGGSNHVQRQLGLQLEVQPRLPVYMWYRNQRNGAMAIAMEPRPVVTSIL